ncbi:hypothetical protein ABDK96_16630 [Citricoccus nitrophenolicus]|uniref:DUF3592 domain-containing protein n=1 Tax=Citricoccus nitrophenolicus TaxID=863575 RepID=A0ABV0IMU4_9MICC
MSGGDYGAVDFQSPVTTLWVVGVLAVIAAGVIGHAVWRRRGHLRFTRRTGRNRDPQLLRDIRAERWTGYACLGVAVVLAGFAGVGAWQTHQNVRSNLQAKYGVTAVEDARWNGAFLVADLTLPDGSVQDDAEVYFEPDGEPLMGEHLFTPGGGL